MSDHDFKAPDSVNDQLIDLVIARGQAEKQAKEHQSYHMKGHVGLGLFGFGTVLLGTAAVTMHIEPALNVLKENGVSNTVRTIGLCGLALTGLVSLGYGAFKMLRYGVPRTQHFQDCARDIDRDVYCLSEPYGAVHYYPETPERVTTENNLRNNFTP